MKVLMVIVGAIALVVSVLLPSLLIVTVPVILLSMLAFIQQSRYDREWREEQRHQELLDATKRGQSG